MAPSRAPAARPRGRFFGAFNLSGLALGWLWLGVALAWPLLVVIVHLASGAVLGPASLPFTPARFAWVILANGSLLGMLVAGQAALRRGVEADLRELGPILPSRLGGAGHLENEIADLPKATLIKAIVLGMGGGFAMATLDPVLRGLHDDLSAVDPRYLLFVVQNLLFGALGFRLFATEIHMTRAYARLGEQVEVDLFDRSPALVFGRKGLRSVVVWVLTSTAISMFWVLDSAGQANVVFPISVLGVTIAALVSPTLGVRRNIARAKTRELEVVTRAIRRERDAMLRPGGTDGSRRDGRLADLIQYEGFVRAIREWPFDLSIVSRSLLFIVLGCGSWLGGAVVERLLGLLLD